MFPSKVSNLAHLGGLWCAFHGVVFSTGGTIVSGVIVWANIAHPNTILFTRLGEKEMLVIRCSYSVTLTCTHTLPTCIPTPTHSCLVDVPVVLHGSGSVVDPVQLAPDLHLLTLNLSADKLCVKLTKLFSFN